MRKRRRLLKACLPLGVFVAIVGILAVGLRNDPSVIPSPLIERAMPTFAARDLFEPQRTIKADDWTGSNALINVWASWCVECRKEHDLLLRLRDNGVLIYGLNYKDERDDALAWLGELGNPYQSNAHDLDGRIGINWGVYGVPETFVVDAAGIIKYKHVGVLSRDVVEDVILPLLVKLERQ